MRANAHTKAGSLTSTRSAAKAHAIRLVPFTGSHNPLIRVIPLVFPQGTGCQWNHGIALLGQMARSRVEGILEPCNRKKKADFKLLTRASDQLASTWFPDRMTSAVVDRGKVIWQQPYDISISGSPSPRYDLCHESTDRLSINV